MANNLNSLQPSLLWEQFQNICNIPHPSKKEGKIIEYVISFAKRLQLNYKTDAVGNIVIFKPATKGFESLQTVVLQAHLDMVPQKNTNNPHNFDTDPIQPIIDGDWVRANGTTLGADNGIGAAAILAVLASNNLQHGPVEALFTIDEETGMTGAFGLHNNFISGSVLLNLDSEEEGEVFIGCAGGVNITATLKFKPENISGNYMGFKISITGLKGGHSGCDIHLGRGNANKLMNRLLWNAEHLHGLKLVSFNGGTLRNAIPREAYAIVAIPFGCINEFLLDIEKFKKIFNSELAGVETDLNIEAEKCDLPLTCIDIETQGKLLDALYALPNGVIRMITDLPTVVETSTNLAIVATNNNEITIKCLLRSSIDSSKTDLANMMTSVFDMAGATTITDGAYPGWKPNAESPILKVMEQTHVHLFGKKPHIKVIHAGLECGIIGNIYPNLDMVSFGPTIRNAHSPDEKVHIPAVLRFWEYLAESLKAVPAK